MKATLLALNTILVPLALSSPMTVDVHITDDSVEGKLVAPARYHETTVNEKPLVVQQEQIPGWIFVEQDRIRARIHGNKSSVTGLIIIEQVSLHAHQQS